MGLGMRLGQIMKLVPHLVLRVNFSMTRRRANCASLVKWSASSRITSLTPELCVVGVEDRGELGVGGWGVTRVVKCRDPESPSGGASRG